MARRFITSVFLYFASITMVYAMGIVCSNHNDSRTDCRNQSGCIVVEANANNNFFCAPDCASFTQPTICKNYAGCTFDATSETCTKTDPNQYPTWDTDHFEYNDCPQNYPNAHQGNDSINFCYKSCANNSDTPQNTCGIYNAGEWAQMVSCLNDTTHTLIPSSLYHLEGTDGCYLNSRPCNLFSAKDNDNSSISGDDKNNISGNAVYDENSQTYNVDSCYYTTTIRSNAGNSHNSDRWCDSEDKYSVSNNTVANANTVLAFNNLNGYYCTACERESNTYPTDDTTGTQHCIAPASPYHKACKCIPIEAGRYGDCSNWNYSNQLSYCQISDCPMGQTTGNTGGTTINDCHYTNDTKICVGTECISLQSMVSNGNQLNVSPNDWRSN